MSSVFLNGLYTFGINGISSATNLILGGSNTNNIQILSPIIGDGNDSLTFSSINTNDIVNTITQNFCFNSTVPSAFISVTNNSTTKNTNITLDASNVTLNSYITIPPISSLPTINQIGYKYLIMTGSYQAIGTTIGRLTDDFYLPIGTWIIEVSAVVGNNCGYVQIGLSTNPTTMDYIHATSTNTASSTSTSIQVCNLRFTSIIQSTISNVPYCLTAYRGPVATTTDAIYVYATRLA